MSPISHTCPYCGRELAIDNVRNEIAHESPGCDSWREVMWRARPFVGAAPDFGVRRAAARAQLLGVLARRP